MTDAGHVDYWNTRKLPTFEQLMKQFAPKEIRRYFDPAVNHEVRVFEERAASGDMR